MSVTLRNFIGKGVHRMQKWVVLYEGAPHARVELAHSNQSWPGSSCFFFLRFLCGQNLPMSASRVAEIR